MKIQLIAGVIIAFLIGAGVGWWFIPKPTPTLTIVFNSTQLRPAEETEWVTDVLLPPFEKEIESIVDGMVNVEVKFVPEEYATFEDRLIAEVEANKVTVSLSGGLHGDFSLLIEKGYLTDLKGIDLPGRTFIETFWNLSFDEGKQVYVPWMQATYIFVANKKALDFLPDGADINSLTYDQLLQWVKNIHESPNGKTTPLGLPVGEGGLIHRFVHGYLYPSFTGKTVANFNTAEAKTMWQYMNELWDYVHTESTTWKSMSGPLLDETVWIAWDHTARFKDAIVQKPNDFVVFPSPAGPKGRGFITVIAGLAIPKGAPHEDLAKKLIEYLTRPETQVDIAEGVGFFPVVEEATGKLPAGALRIIADGVVGQSSAQDALVAMLPVGLGGRSGEFSAIYRDTFKRILIDGEAIDTVLSDQWTKLDTLYDETGAPYPLPG
jgi:multiple sugar transport system substrate-binding protein